MSAKKCLFVLILTLLSVSLAFADPPAVHPKTGEPLVIECLRGTPDAIDGDLSDWDLLALTPAVLDVEEQLNSGQTSWSGPDDLSGEFYLLWDDENIYIAAIVKDDKLSMNKTGGDIWNADAIEIFFATTDAIPTTSPPSTIHYQYGFNANDQRWNWCNMDGTTNVEPAYLQIASSETADGYICEAAIAYGEILSLDFSVGNTIGFHPVIDDTDDTDREIQMTWTSREAHNQSEGYGHLLLSDKGATPGFSSSPIPKNGALVEATWATLGWKAGEFAASHDIYLGVDFDDVNDATRDSDEYWDNVDVDTTYLIVGFPTFPYPDGLVPGTTYYWRIDEVNAPPDDSVYKGKVWSFSVPSKTAYEPVPADGAEFVDLNVELTWTLGLEAKLSYIVFGDDFDEVSNAATGTQTGPARYSPGPLELAKTYYWRIDQSDGFGTYKGEVWTFTTEGAVSGPNPADGAEDVSGTQILTWVAGAVAASHDVYFGTDADAVKNATKASGEYKGSKALGDESYDPGILTLNTDYFWRIDEVNATNPLSPWQGNVWSFTTGNYLVIDDFEDYNTTDKQIWETWLDGLGYGALGTPNYNPGNGTGSAVGDENSPSYMEETIVNSGTKSMPLAYDNNKQGLARYSEVELTLSNVRDWTLEGVGELSLWFRGYPAEVGSFAEGPTGTYTMVGSGTDIWEAADEFHYAYKTLAGVGSIVARVQSIDNTNNWAKAGVMIRETLEPGSTHASMVVTPAQGVSFQRRVSADGTSTDTTTADIVAPQWVKIERDLGGNFTASYSANGSTWTSLGTENIQMNANVYIGLAVTSHDAALACQAVITNVTTSGNVGPQWMNQDIGITSNDTEPLYLAISNSAGNPVVVTHDDPAAANIDVWTEWIIPLQSLADQGLTLPNVDKIAIGLGTKGNMNVPGGKGKMYFDDVRLYQPRTAP